MITYEEKLKLLEKFKPCLIVRILWWFNQTIRNESFSTLQYNIANLEKAKPTEDDFIMAYYAKRELDRRDRKQEKFIEGLKRK